MRRLSQALTAALITLAAITPAAPAAAATTYLWLSCPAGTSSTGYIDTAGTRYDTPTARYVAEVSGVLNLCRKPLPMIDIFGIARYGSGSATGLRYSFGSNPTQQYSYQAGIPIQADTQAVCVVANNHTRLACVSITWSAIEGDLRPEIQGALPIDDPMVSYTAYFPAHAPVVGPVCNNCE